MINIVEILQKEKAYIETDGDVKFCGISQSQFPEIFLTLEILAKDCGKRLDDFAVDVYYSILSKKVYNICKDKLEEAREIVLGFWECDY